MYQNKHIETEHYSINFVEYDDGSVHLAIWEKDFEGCEPLQAIDQPAPREEALPIKWAASKQTI